MTLNNFRISDFAAAPKPEAQASGLYSNIIKYDNRVVCTIGTKPTNNSTFSRLKYKLEENYFPGDDFWIWENIQLPPNYYEQQNGSMRLIGLWNNTEYGRLGLWIDSKQIPRLQIEKKDKTLASVPLWSGQPKEIPTGKHYINLHIVLGQLIELYVDKVLYARVAGNNLPYSGYTANQIIYMFDGANANTHMITAICWEVGASDNAPFDIPGKCDDLEAVYLAAMVKRQAAETETIIAIEVLRQKEVAEATARQEEINALNALNACRMTQ